MNRLRQGRWLGVIDAFIERALCNTTILQNFLGAHTAWTIDVGGRLPRHRHRGTPLGSVPAKVIADVVTGQIFAASSTNSKSFAVTVQSIQAAGLS